MTDVAEIVATFTALPVSEIVGHNWGTCGRDCPHSWEVDDDTYINGVVLTVDGDYWMGYLVEVVARSSGAVTYQAVTTFHGHRADGSIDHDVVTYDVDCGTFFDRTEAADPVVVGTWALPQIFNMAEMYFETRQHGGDVYIRPEEP